LRGGLDTRYAPLHQGVALRGRQEGGRVRAAGQQAEHDNCTRRSGARESGTHSSGTGDGSAVGEGSGWLRHPCRASTQEDTCKRRVRCPLRNLALRIHTSAGCDITQLLACGILAPTHRTAPALAAPPAGRASATLPAQPRRPSTDKKPPAAPQPRGRWRCPPQLPRTETSSAWQHTAWRFSVDVTLVTQEAR
jgi:hypothetical protein